MIFVWYPLFVFVCFKRDLFVVRISTNWVFGLCFIISFISLERLFKLLSSFFLLYTFVVGVKSKFLLKSFTLTLWERNAVKLTTFPSGSDLNLIDSSIFLRNWKKFSLILRWMKLHPEFLFFLFALLFWRPLSVFSISLNFSLSLNFSWILMSMIHCYVFDFFVLIFQFCNFLIPWLIVCICCLLLSGRWSWPIPSGVFCAKWL